MDEFEHDLRELSQEDLLEVVNRLRSERKILNNVASISIIFNPDTSTDFVFTFGLVNSIPILYDRFGKWGFKFRVMKGLWKTLFRIDAELKNNRIRS